MFVGQYSHSVDTKGRLAIPAKFRGELKKAVVTKGLDNCLFLYPKKEWDKLAEQTKIWKLNDYINTIGKEAGFSKMNPYFLRHTFGVMHYNAYNDILKTRDKMGQLNVSATEVYAVSDDVWKDKSRELLEVGL